MEASVATLMEGTNVLAEMDGQARIVIKVSFRCRYSRMR